MEPAILAIFECVGFKNSYRYSFSLPSAARLS